MFLVIPFKAMHISLVRGMRWFWCSHGARMRRRPSAQAWKYWWPGLEKVLKPQGVRKIRGRWASRAARMMACSPLEMAGETSTAPCRALARKRVTCSATCSSVRLREHCTCSLCGLLRRNWLPMAA